MAVVSERTWAMIGTSRRSGAACENCGTSYAVCTEKILLRRPSKACCSTCAYTDTHDARDDPATLPPVTTYEVWADMGSLGRSHPTAHRGFAHPASAQRVADELNDGLPAESRGKIRWVVVRATTTFERKDTPWTP